MWHTPKQILSTSLFAEVSTTSRQTTRVLNLAGFLLKGGQTTEVTLSAK
jgi:hypothetical protein